MRYNIYADSSSSGKLLFGLAAIMNNTLGDILATLRGKLILLSLLPRRR